MAWVKRALSSPKPPTPHGPDVGDVRGRPDPDRRRFVRGTVTGVVAALAGCATRALSVPGDGQRSAGPIAEDCPTPHSLDRTVCPAADGGPLAVWRSRRRVAHPDWSLIVTVENRAEQPYVTEPSGWSVFGWEDDGWARLVGGTRVGSRTEVAPGGTYRWLLAPGDVPDVVGDRRLIFELDPGRYSFAVPFIGPDRIAAVAPFEVVE